MKKNIIIIVSVLTILVFCQPIIAQNENPFLDRGFWRKKPSLETVQKKLDEGHSLKGVNYYGYDALSNAILGTNDLEITKLLVKNGADIHKKIERSGRTPAFWAVYKDNYDMLKYFIDKGVKATIKDKNGNSLIGYAASSGASDNRIYDLLLKKGAKLKGVKDQYGRNALLMYASRMKNTKMIDYFLAKGLSIKSLDKDGNGVFNYAARTKNKEFLKALVKRGASPKANANTGENAFTFATRGRGGSLTLEFLEYLESLGLKPTAKTKQGSNCLSNISFSEKKPEIFKYFIKKGVNPNDADSNGNTPLIRASYRNSEPVINYLIGVTNNLNHKNKDGYTALASAIRRNKPNIVKILIEKGADITIRDKKNNDLGTMLVDSYRSSDMKVFREKMEILVQNGYKPLKASVQNGNNLLQVAIRNGNPVLINEIIKMQVPINFKNDEGYTPLHVAAMTAKNDKVIKALLTAGADKSIKTEFGESAYELAIENETLKNKKIDLNFLR